MTGLGVAVNGKPVPGLTDNLGEGSTTAANIPGALQAATRLDSHGLGADALCLEVAFTNCMATERNRNVCWTLARAAFSSAG